MKMQMEKESNQPNTRVHTVLSRRRARQGPREGDVQMLLLCLAEP